MAKEINKNTQVNKDQERLHLESRFDDIINGLWCVEEKQKYLGMKDEILNDLSNAELKERLDKFQTTCDNMEIVEKYLTIAVTNIMDEAEENGQPDLADRLQSALKKLFDIYLHMNKTLNGTGMLIPIEFKEELADIIFENPSSLYGLYEGLFQFQVESPHFYFSQSQTLEIRRKDYDLYNPGDEELSSKFPNLNANEITRMKEYRCHLRYIQSTVKFHKKLSNSKILFSMIPSLDYSILKEQLDNRLCTTFQISAKGSFRKLMESIDPNFKKKNRPKLQSEIFGIPYSRSKIEKKYNFILQNIFPEVILLDDQHYYNRIVEYINTIKTLTQQTIIREFLASFDFHTLNMLAESLSTKLIEDNEKLQLNEKFIDLMEDTRRKIEKLQDEDKVRARKNKIAA